MYIVRFVRKDGKQDEEYYYHVFGDAEYHFQLFKKDDSGLYATILLLKYEGSLTQMINQLKF